MTRPSHQASAFINMLQQAGAETFALPAIEILPLTPDADIKQHMSEPGRYQLVIFISANAVRYGLPLLQKNPATQIAAIGEGSARCLTELGWQVDVMAESGFSSEDLLALPALQTSMLAGKQLLIVRGQGGREHLAEILRSRGATVEYAEVYQRCRPRADTQWLAPIWQDHIHLVCVTSNETLENLYHMLHQFHNRLLNTLLLVPSSRAYQLALKLGFKNIIQAASATDTDMLQRILQWQNQQHQTGV